jgi:hypothetical protein
MYLWRAVDHEGEVLDMLVQRRRDKRAALRLMRKLLRKQGFAPKLLTTDATALSLQTAISAKVAPPRVTLPWSTLCKAINNALNSRFLEVVAGGPVSWPCEAQSAAAVEFRLPTTGSGISRPQDPDSAKS